MTRTTTSSLIRWRASGFRARETVEISTRARTATSRIVTREGGLGRFGARMPHMIAKPVNSPARRSALLTRIFAAPTIAYVCIDCCIHQMHDLHLRKGRKGMAGQHEPTIVRPSDIDPHHNWDRPIQAPGQMQVDFEERVNFRRLHDYRLARVRQALARSELGALLSFDQ